MQQRVHATESPCNVPCHASAHACTARALASPALASPVLTACARLHTHILRSAHLHRACRSLLCHLALLVEVRFCLTFGNRLVEAHIHSTTLILHSQKQLERGHDDAHVTAGTATVVVPSCPSLVDCVAIVRLLDPHKPSAEPQDGEQFQIPRRWSHYAESVADSL